MKSSVTYNTRGELVCVGENSMGYDEETGYVTFEHLKFVCEYLSESYAGRYGYNYKVCSWLLWR